MTPPEPFPTAALLAESAWLHRLALRLVAEPAGAADAAQETLAKALETPPTRPVSLRQWLAAVLRNVVRQERRARGRREARERACLGADGCAQLSEPSDELAARLELHQTLVAAVRALAEPYRTTVALRYLEDLPVSSVAERMGVPEKTVYSRLERALADLRARLDRGYGRRSAWAGLLVPFFPPAPGLDASGASLSGAAPALPAPVSTLSAPLSAPFSAPFSAPLLAPLLAMSTLWKWSGACAALATVGFFAVRSLSSSDARGPGPAPAVGASARAELERPPALELDVLASVPRRAELSASAAETAPPAQPTPLAAPAPVLVGFVLDLERRPVSGLEVVYEPVESSLGASLPLAPPPGRALSDGEGRFELPVAEGACRIVARGRGLATVIAPILAGPPPPEPPLVFVGPARSYAGQVLDEQGTPVAGAEVGVHAQRELVRRLTPGAFVGSWPSMKGTADAHGRFEFVAVGQAAGSHVSAWAPGFRKTQLELPPESSAALVLVLARDARSKTMLAGRVERADGRAAGGAYVSVGQVTRRADEEGRFELELEPEASPERVCAVLEGHLPAELELAGLRADERHELVLVLGGEALAIRGRVVDGEGQARAGVEVWTMDGERFGEITRELGEVSFSLTYELEDLIAGLDDPVGTGRRVRTDAEGRFELTALLARRYGLWLLDPETYEVAGPREVAAGSAAVELVLPRELRERVAGRVLSFSGAPVVGASVSVSRMRRDAQGNERTLRPARNQSVTTDEEGRFEFAALGLEGTTLVVASKEAPREASFALADQPDAEQLELAFAATCHVRVHLDDPARADSLSLRDERDQPLDVTFQIGSVLCMSHGVQIQGGISDLLTTDETARTLVLGKDGQETERIPIRLTPGAVNDLRL